LLTAFLATSAFGGAGLAEGVSAGSQFITQLIGVGAVLAWSLAATFIIVKITAAITGLRVSDDHEMQGLDTTAHGETGYNL
jgi:Amt family ammonium transporter